MIFLCFNLKHGWINGYFLKQQCKRLCRKDCAGMCLRGHHWQSDKIVYVHNPLSCFPVGRGLLQWLFQMRKPEAAAPVAVRQLMAVWLSPHCALFRLRRLCVSLLCSWERLQRTVWITAVIRRAFVLTWLSFITELGSAHFNGPSEPSAVHSTEPDVHKQPFWKE